MNQSDFLENYNGPVKYKHTLLKKVGSVVLLSVYAVSFIAAPVFATGNLGTEGCTPGFWKQTQHFDSWTAPYEPTDQFSSVFEDAFPGMTLLDVLGQGGGDLNALGRHTVAALLNGANPNVDYAYSASEVIQLFNDVFPGGVYEALKAQFSSANEQGCPNPDAGDVSAKLVVIKYVINNDEGTAVAGDFTMIVNAQSPSETSFAGSEQGHEITVQPGSYSVDEQDNVDYLKSLSDGCSGLIAAGETKTCTITNNDKETPQPERGTLTVIKQVVNDDGGPAVIADFTLSVNDIDQNSFVVTSAQANVFLPGNYTVGESGGPSGYNATFSGDCAANGSVTIEANHVYTCTIINNDITPKLTVIKHVDNTGSGTMVAVDFTMLVSALQPSLESFPGSETGTEITLSAGAYSVSEELEDNYTASYSIDCTGTIAINQNKTCTVTNTFVPPLPPVKGRLTVTKVVTNDDGGEAVVADFDLFVGQTQVTSGDTNDFEVDTYTVSESGGPAGYSAAFSGDCDTDGQVAISENASATCTITNNDIADEEPPCTENCGGGEEPPCTDCGGGENPPPPPPTPSPTPPPPSGGGGSVIYNFGGGGGGVPTPPGTVTPPPQIAGGQIIAPPPVPQVEGTVLPRTGSSPVMLGLLLGLIGTAVFVPNIARKLRN